jgi:sulfur carrier protein ThiS
MEISIRSTSTLSELVPPSGKLEIRDSATVDDVFRELGIDGDLVMLIVVDGELADVDSRLRDGARLELIPPISGG